MASNLVKSLWSTFCQAVVSINILASLYLVGSGFDKVESDMEPQEDFLNAFTCLLNAYTAYTASNFSLDHPIVACLGASKIALSSGITWAELLTGGSNAVLAFAFSKTAAVGVSVIKHAESVNAGRTATMRRSH